MECLLNYGAMKYKEHLEKLRKEKEGRIPKLWELTLEETVVTPNMSDEPWVDTRTIKEYVTSDGKTNPEDVKNWWNETHMMEIDTKKKAWQISQKCVDVQPWEPEKRDWIVMPSLKS